MLLEQGIMGVFINPPYSGSNLGLPASHFNFDTIVHFAGNDTSIPGSSPSACLHLGRSPNRNVMAHSLSHPFGLFLNDLPNLILKTLRGEPNVPADLSKHRPQSFKGTTSHYSLTSMFWSTLHQKVYSMGAALSTTSVTTNRKLAKLGISGDSTTLTRCCLGLRSNPWSIASEIGIWNCTVCVLVVRPGTGWFRAVRLGVTLACPSHKIALAGTSNSPVTLLYTASPTSLSVIRMVARINWFGIMARPSTHCWVNACCLTMFKATERTSCLRTHPGTA